MSDRISKILGEGHKFTTQLESPGPGSYYPEYFENSKVYSFLTYMKKLTIKSSSFGSTRKRFEVNTSKSSIVPAPGSYELSQVKMFSSNKRYTH